MEDRMIIKLGRLDNFCCYKLVKIRNFIKNYLFFFFFDSNFSLAITDEL